MPVLSSAPLCLQGGGQGGSLDEFFQGSGSQPSGYIRVPWRAGKNSGRWAPPQSFCSAGLGGPEDLLSNELPCDVGADTAGLRSTL